MLESGKRVILSSIVHGASHLKSSVISSHNVFLEILCYQCEIHIIGMYITELYLYTFLTRKYFCINVKHNSVGSVDMRECAV